MTVRTAILDAAFRRFLWISALQIWRGRKNRRIG